MNNKSKKFFLLILLAVIVGALSVGSNTYARLLVDLLLSGIDKSQVNIQVTSPTLSFSGIKAESIWIKPNTAPTSFTIDQATVGLSLKSLLNGSIILDGHGTFNSGKLNVKYSPLQNKVSIKIDNANISQHHLLSGFGITKANLSAEVIELSYNSEDNLPNIKTINLSINDLAKPAKTSLPSFLTGLPMQINIPKIADANLTIVGSINSNESEISFDQIKLVSSLISGNGKGNIKILKEHSNRSINLKITANSTKEGFGELGDLIKMLSSSQINKHGQEFRFIVNGPLTPMPQIKITPANAAEGL